MKSRTQRLLSVKKIISELRIGSQDELLKKLHESGFDVTQATLSRDLKALQVMKVSDSDRGYVYRLPGGGNFESVTDSNVELSRANFLADGFIGVEFSGNLSVVKTLPGYASSIAAVIDKSKMFEIIGTIAGDDTVLLVIREGIGRSDVVKALVLTMPKLEGRI
jgi:transcriptional regulator of arginine metabolism